jgi:sugar O-acyltransferase (sialic acid O-acetyltransferase NeuD family)
MAREICWLLREINAAKPLYEFLGYVVSDLDKCGQYDSREGVLGDYRWLEENRSSIDAVTIGIGTPAARLKVGRELRTLIPDVEMPALIHPSVVLDFASAKIGPGVQICAGTIATVNITLDSLALCNVGCTLGHEVVIGRGSVINPGANISGGVVLDAGVLVGAGAQILQYRRVGEGATVGAGAVVLENVEPWTTVVGVPARMLTSIPSSADGTGNLIGQTKLPGRSNAPLTRYRPVILTRSSHH